MIQNSDSSNPLPPADNSHSDAPNDDRIDVKPTNVPADIERKSRLDASSSSSSDDSDDCKDPWYWCTKWEEFRKEGRVDEETNRVFGEELERKSRQEGEEAAARLAKVIAEQEEFKAWQECLTKARAEGRENEFQGEFEGTQPTPMHKQNFANHSITPVLHPIDPEDIDSDSDSSYSFGDLLPRVSPINPIVDDPIIEPTIINQIPT